MPRQARLDAAGTLHHVTLLKRLVRKTICFSKSVRLHDIVVGLFVNRYEFGLVV
jgi:hypothetical protein